MLGSILSQNYTNLKSNMYIKKEEVSVTVNRTEKAEKSNNKSVLGYPVDEKGYFTKEFNDAAGIPESFKIHSSTMESLVKINTQGESVFYGKLFKSIDIAATVGNAYKMLSQIVGEDKLKQQESFSKEDLATFPQGYEYDRATLKVTKTYDTIYDFRDASDRYNYKNSNNHDMITTFFI